MQRNKALSINIQLPRDNFCLQVEFEFPATGVTAIFGHSGCGKTSLLRCIAGLESSAVSLIQLGSTIWQDKQTYIATHQRSIGYVFQEPSLLPHLRVKNNLKFALKRANAGEPLIQYHEVIELLGLNPVLESYPEQLSGGEKQRVAIACALLINPQILLMDEPLASLDKPRKLEILPFLEKLTRQLNIPILYVTHSTDEVFRLADQVLLLEQGKVAAHGGLAQVFSQINTPALTPLERASVIMGEIIEHDTQWHLMRVRFTGGELWLSDHQFKTFGQANIAKYQEMGNQVRVSVHPKDVSIALEAQQDSSILNILSAIIIDIGKSDEQGFVLIKVQAGPHTSQLNTPQINTLQTKEQPVELLASITARSLHQLNLAIGQLIWVQIKSAALLR